MWDMGGKGFESEHMSRLNGDVVDSLSLFCFFSGD